MATILKINPDRTDSLETWRRFCAGMLETATGPMLRAAWQHVCEAKTVEEMMTRYCSLFGGAI